MIEPEYPRNMKHDTCRAAWLLACDAPSNQAKGDPSKPNYDARLDPDLCWKQAHILTIPTRAK